MSGIVATLAGHCLFKFNQMNLEFLSGEDKDNFVHVVMQLLYLSQRGRPDI